MKITRIVRRLLLLLILIPFQQTLFAATLQDVRKKGFIDCGVHSSLPGFAIQSEHGWQGMEVDLCRAVAAAVLNSAQNVRFTPIAGGQGYGALQSGDIDLLVRHNRWTMLPDTAMGITFVAPWFYLEQGFLVVEDTETEQIGDLTGKKVCVYPEAEEITDRDIEQVSFPSFGIAAKAFENGQCAALTGDLPQLSITCAALAEIMDCELLNDKNSPLATGPLVRQGDHEWFKIVRWTIYWLMNAERLGITSDSVDMLTDDSPALRKIASAGLAGISIGLDDEWPLRVVRQVGNYGEIFKHHFGAYPLPRGVNRLVDKGGLHAAPTIE